MASHPIQDPIAEAHRQWAARGLAEADAMATATSIIRIQQLVSTTVERALRPLGLTFARYEVLMLLSFTSAGAMPITKMGSRLMVHPTGITKLVDKLEEQGFVERRPNPDDRRGTLASITSEGRAIAARATEAMAQVRYGVDLPADALHRLRAAADELRRTAGDL